MGSVDAKTARLGLPLRLSFTVRLSLLYLAVAAILVIVGVRVWHATNQFASDNDWVAHTYNVEAQINAVIARLGTLQTDAIGYAANGDETRLARFRAQAPLMEDDLGLLLKLVADNPEQVQRAQQLAAAIRGQRDLAAAMLQARQGGNNAAAPADFGIGGVRGLAALMLDEEDRLLMQRRLDTADAATRTRTLTSIAIALSLLFLALTFWLVRGSQQRSRRARESLRAANSQLAEALVGANRLSESMTRLSQFGEMLQSCRSLDEVRNGLGGALAEMLPDLGGRLALINPSQNLAAIGAHWGRHGLIAESVFAPEDCWALRRGQAYPLAGAHGGFVCKHVHWPNPDMPDAGYLCVPLTAHGETIGVLTFDGERSPTLEERRIALTAGEQVALALANLRLQETLRTQSVRDPLTGLFNRRYLEVSLERELLRASRRSLPLAVLMLDIDYFKRFNDTYGHEAGDTLLAQFAEVLKRCVRAEDIACRYGGEEFTVVLLDADPDGTAQRAEYIRATVAEMSVLHRQQQLERVTVSIGAAVFPRDAASREDLLRRADTALYAAKKAGRDRVVLASALLEMSVPPGEAARQG
jgi:diguanylate cyclase (GGDEF)-like protein